jgi:hypothetical protein
MGIWVHPYADIPLEVGVDFMKIGGMAESEWCCKVVVEVPKSSAAPKYGVFRHFPPFFFVARRFINNLRRFLALSGAFRRVSDKFPLREQIFGGAQILTPFSGWFVLGWVWGRSIFMDIVERFFCFVQWCDHCGGGGTDNWLGLSLAFPPVDVRGQILVSTKGPACKLNYSELVLSSLLKFSFIDTTKALLKLSQLKYRRTRSLRTMQPKRTTRKGHRTYSPASRFDLIPSWKVILATIAVFLFTIGAAMENFEINKFHRNTLLMSWMLQIWCVGLIVIKKK